jgi:hypothetical protein
MQIRRQEDAPPRCYSAQGRAGLSWDGLAGDALRLVQVPWSTVYIPCLPGGVLLTYSGWPSIIGAGSLIRPSKRRDPPGGEGLFFLFQNAGQRAA